MSPLRRSATEAARMLRAARLGAPLLLTLLAAPISGAAAQSAETTAAGAAAGAPKTGVVADLTAIAELCRNAAWRPADQWAEALAPGGFAPVADAPAAHLAAEAAQHRSARATARRWLRTAAADDPAAEMMRKTLAAIPTGAEAEAEAAARLKSLSAHYAKNKRAAFRRADGALLVLSPAPRRSRTPRSDCSLWAPVAIDAAGVDALADAVLGAEREIPCFGDDTMPWLMRSCIVFDPQNPALRLTDGERRQTLFLNSPDGVGESMLNVEFSLRPHADG